MTSLFCLGGCVLYNVCFDIICFCIELFFWIAETVTTPVKSGGTSLRTALFTKLTLSPASVQFSVKIVFFIPIKTGAPFSIWMTVPCSYIAWILLTNREAHGTSRTVKITQKLQRTKSCFFKKKLKQISLPIKDFSVDFYLFNFINGRKCLSAIILWPLERTEALAPCVRRNSRWSNCKHYYSLPKARSFTDFPYCRKLT